MRLRGFEVVSNYNEGEIILPVRKTKYSAGYDIAAAEDAELSPNTVTLVATGLKVYMQNDEYLGIHIRSGLSIKNCISLVNGQGIIDADYYNNCENEGHILIAMYNHSNRSIKISKGTRVAQGIFYKYLLVDADESCSFLTRAGGLGSTGN